MAGKYTDRELEVITRKVVDYNAMPYFSSVILARVNDSWDKVENCNVMNADLLCKVTKNLSGPSFSVTAKVSTFSIKAGGNSVYDQINAEYFGASAGTSVSAMHAEANAKATLAAGDVGPLSYHAGVGVGTGAGIKDDSVTVKVAGCGVQVGRKVGVSVLGNSVGVDFGKVFGGLF